MSTVTRPPRARYHHLSGQQLATAEKLLGAKLDKPNQYDVIRLADRLGLTETELREAVWRWRYDTGRLKVGELYDQAGE